MHRKDGTIFPAQVSNSPVVGDDGDLIGVVGISFDITTRRRREANLAFLADLSQDLIPVEKTSEIVQTFGEKINRLTNASVCAFFEISENKDEAVCAYEWHRADSGGLIGKFNIPELVSDEFQKLMAAGETVIIRDINLDERARDKRQLASYGIGSFVNIPLIRRGEWKFVLGVYHGEPYDWRDDEISLLEEAANRIWTKIERLHAQKNCANPKNVYG